MTETAGSVAVIGAGPAGLAAAWRLSESGPVVVYEARDRVGGLLGTETVAGRTADGVAQLLSDGYTRTLELLGAMGLGGRVVEVPGRDAVWRNGRPHALRYGSAMSMAASGALPMRLKLRLGLRYVPFLERHADVLELNDPAVAVEAGLDDESIAEWGRRELGEDFVERMAYPLLATYYGVAPEETSAALFHSLAAAGLHVSVLGVRGGFGPLMEAVAGALADRGVELRLGAAVDALEIGPSGVTVRWSGGRAGHAGAVVAVPAAAAAALLPTVSWLGGLRTRSTATLVLAMDRPLETGWFGLSVPRREPPGREIAAVCVQSEKGTGLGGAGDALVVIPAPAVAAEWAADDPAAVLARALPGLERLLPGAGDRIIEARLIRHHDAVVPAPGHFARVRAGAGEAPAGVALAGDYLVAPTVEGAVRSGLVAADRVADRLPGGG